MDIYNNKLMGFTKYTHNGKEYNKSSKEEQWKLVYDGTKIIIIDHDDGETSTSKDVFASKKFKDIQKFIEDNNLDINSKKLIPYGEFYAKVAKTDTLTDSLISFIDTLRFTA